METTKQSAHRRLIGTVKSAKMAKTIVVTVERKIQHPKYGKTYAVSRSFKAHDAQGKARAGDIVEIEETRPMSSGKRWRYVRTVTAAATSLASDRGVTPLSASGGKTI